MEAIGDKLFESIKAFEKIRDEFDEYKNNIDKLKKIQYLTFMNMEQNEQLKFAFDNFEFCQDFTTDDFKLDYSNIMVISSDNYSSDGNRRYLIKNNLDNKRYYIEFELDEKFLLICRNHQIFNDFIEKYPDEDFTKLYFNIDLTKKFSNDKNLEELKIFFANSTNPTDSTNPNLTDSTNLEYLLSNLFANDSDKNAQEENSIFSELYENLFFTIDDKIFQFTGTILSDAFSEGNWNQV